MRVALPRLTMLAALIAAACMVFAVAPRLPEADGAGASQQTVVSDLPGTNTPNISNGTVRSITQVGPWIIVAGSFTAALSPGSSTPVTRNGVLAFDADTGMVAAGFAPSIDGSVNVVITGQTPNTVYIGGQFTTVNGVASRNIAMLNLADGSLMSGFRPTVLNGAVQDMRLSGDRLYVVGGFTTAGGVSHQGIATLNPKTGAVEPFMNVQLTGHHNYNGTGAKGSLGGRALDISPDGSRAVVVGNFKHANGVLHDQIVMLDLTGTTASVQANWNTAAFSAACAARSFDTYVRDVDFSPDGSYFAVVTTGASTFSTNTDGTRSLCDSASRWETNATGSNIRPTWVDYTGNDSLWSVVCTGIAIYAGGHQRWANNPHGSDRAAPGAIARPGIMALDPLNGMPRAWNPGRNPRGAGAYALFATSDGLYVGSDTDYIGNFKYKRQKIAFLPIDGGETPPSTATAQLPGKLYLAGPANGSAANSLVFHSVNGSTIGATNSASSNIDWDDARGVFRVGDTIFYGATDGSFHGVSIGGTTMGTSTTYDPYDDPLWDSVATGSGQTYQGVRPGFFTEIPSVTGAFYWNGRIYYTLQDSRSLFWRYFEPDDGAIGGRQFRVAAVSVSSIAGMVLSGSRIYYANSTDGTLHTVPFVNGVPHRAQDRVISGPLIDGIDWRARGMFVLKN